MRRLLLIFLMVVLPLQSAWAAAASVCAHETGSSVSHFGHHQHEHDGEKTGAKNVDGAAPGWHADCGVCHGVGTAFVAVLIDMPRPWTAPIRFDSFESVVLDRALDSPLRPPSSLVS